MININKLNKILYNDYGIILNESELTYLEYLNVVSNKSRTGILKEFFTKCTTRHLCLEKNINEFKVINKKLLHEEISHRDRESIKGSGVIDHSKYLDSEGIVEIEEETNTISGNEGLNIKTGEKNISKEFETKQEADLYKKKIENTFLVHQGAATKRAGGIY